MKKRFCSLSAAMLAAIFSLLAQPHNASSQQPGLPSPDHIVVVIFENHNYDDIIGSASAPHFNALASDDHSALFTDYHAIEHPSQPNYLDLYAGCNQGIQDDAVPSNLPFTTENLGRELLDAGKTFVTYSEDLPSVGYNGSGAGGYARKHNPAANWMGTGMNQIPLTTNRPYTQFPTDYSTLPTVCFLVPNLTDDMHDGTISQGDAWLNKNLNGYIQWAKTHNSLLVLTFDEDELTTGGAILTIIEGESVRAGQYSELLNHYSILRTIEDMYGLPHACNAATASPITDVWTTSAVSSHPTLEDYFAIYPNPASDLFTVSHASANAARTSVMNVLGETVYELPPQHKSPFTLDLSGLHAGTYFVRFATSTSIETKKIVRK